jgi:hypothetical protein
LAAIQFADNGSWDLPHEEHAPPSGNPFGAAWAGWQDLDPECWSAERRARLLEALARFGATLGDETAEAPEPEQEPGHPIAPVPVKDQGWFSELRHLNAAIKPETPEPPAFEREVHRYNMPFSSRPARVGGRSHNPFKRRHRDRCFRCGGELEDNKCIKCGTEFCSCGEVLENGKCARCAGGEERKQEAEGDLYG